MTASPPPDASSTTGFNDRGSSVLPAPVPGTRVTIESPAGEISVYVSGTGKPLLLIHSINAAASAAEVRPLHEHFSASRQVFSIDLPGYGLSARKDLPYSPSIMTQAVHRAVQLIHGRCGPAPIDALALSLSCEFLARAAAESPQDFKSLALVSPTGFRGGRALRAAPGSTRAIPWLYALLRGPGWGRGLFRLLTRPAVVRYFLERTWGSKRIDEELWRYAVLTAAQPNAEYAPLLFLSGHLFSADIHTVYEALVAPVWMSHGIRGDFTDYRGKSLVEGRDNWTFSVFSTGALPHFELTREFCETYTQFMAPH